MIYHGLSRNEPEECLGFFHVRLADTANQPAEATESYFDATGQVKGVKPGTVLRQATHASFRHLLHCGSGDKAVVNCMSAIKTSNPCDRTPLIVSNMSPISRANEHILDFIEKQRLKSLFLFVRTPPIIMNIRHHPGPIRDPTPVEITSHRQGEGGDMSDATVGALLSLGPFSCRSTNAWGLPCGPKPCLFQVKIMPIHQVATPTPRAAPKNGLSKKSATLPQHHTYQK